MSETQSPWEQDGLFIFDADPVIEWPVRIKMSLAGGGVRTAEVPMELQYTDAGELQRVIREIVALPVEQLGTKDDPLVELVHSWRGLGQAVRGGKAQELPCTAKTKAVVLKRGNVRQAVIEALLQMASGAEAKNSETPAAPGPAPNRRARRAKTRGAKKLNGT